MYDPRTFHNYMIADGGVKSGGRQCEICVVAQRIFGYTTLNETLRSKDGFRYDQDYTTFLSQAWQVRSLEAIPSFIFKFLQFDRFNLEGRTTDQERVDCCRRPFEHQSPIDHQCSFHLCTLNMMT